MSKEPANNRKPEAGGVDPQFPDRWSPRAFSDKKIPEDVLMTLFEAARWAPSSMNEQPWFFIYAAADDDLTLFRQCVKETNRVWADKAPVIAFVLAKKKFDRNGDENFHALFDTGAAWMSLALQARKMGLYAHAMGGIYRDKVYNLLGVPQEEYHVACGVAIGYYGDPSTLPPALLEREFPSGRKSLSKVAAAGRFVKP